MAKLSDRDRVKARNEQITAACTAYKTWEDRFKCKQLVDYYEGKQWYGVGEEDASKAYTVNLIFPTIEIQLPSLLFFNPKVVVSPRPAHADDPGSMAPDRAKLAEDTIQTFVDDPAVHFKLNTLLALRDAEFRFGLVEVGYSADWLDNPNAEKPILKEGTEDPLTGEGGTPVPTPTKVPRPGSERIYVKRIPAESFRTSVSGCQVLTENDWVGYYEFHRVEDVQANPKYSNTGRLKPSGTEKASGEAAADEDQDRYRGMVKLWKIWDLRSKTRIVLADGHDKFLLEEPYTYLPLAGLKFFERAAGWYPIPPVFNWIDSQNEMNEIRESRKVHRRRFYRRYTYLNGSIYEAELEKLESGGDGVYAKANQPNAIMAVPDASLGPDTDKDLLESRNDFMQLSGVSADARQMAEPETATQANIIDAHSRIRESSHRTLVGEWLGEICRLILLCVVEKMQLPFWIQQQEDPFAQDQQGAAVTQALWQQLSATSLENLSVDVKVDITTLSPVTEQQQMLSWNQVLALIANPQMAMILSMSEPLLKKTLAFYGVKNPQEVREIQGVMKNVLMMQMAMAAQGQPAGGGPGTSSTASAGHPPVGTPSGGGMVQ